MAATNRCGFETGGTKELRAAVGASFTVQSTTKRTGTYAAKILNPTSGVAHGGNMKCTSGAGTIHRYACIHFRLTTAPNAKTTFLSLSSDDTTVGVAGFAMKSFVNTSGQISFLAGGAAPTESSTNSITLNDWNRLEFRTLPGSSVAELEVKLNGTQVYNVTNATFSTGVSNLNFGANLSVETATTGEWYFDDAGHNDDSGTEQNSWLGDTNIVHLIPNVQGDFAEGDSGPTGGQSGYLMVDELDPNDATDYWILITSSASPTSADRLDVNLSSFAPTDVTIKCVLGGYRLMPATNATCNYIPRIKSQASGNITEGTTTSVTGTAWVTHDDSASTAMPRLVSYTDPQAGGPWTPALLNSAQLGVRSGDATPDVWVTAMWLTVDYTAVVAAALPRPLFVRQAVNRAARY